MAMPQTPEGWQKPREAPADTRPPMSAAARAFGYVLMTVLLVGGIAGYVLIGRDTSLAGSLPLPLAFETRSASHDDLMLLGRELTEIATDAEQRLGFHDRAAAAMGTRLRARVRTIHDAGRLLEPRLTREETRTLMAYEEAELIIGDYIAAATEGAGDDEQIELAKKQIATGLAVGQGQPVANVIVRDAVTRVKHSQAMQDLNDVRHAKLRLVDE